jgi:hypothetical protein
MDIPFDNERRWVEFPFKPFVKDEGEQPEGTVYLYELSEGDRFEDADGRRYTYCAEGPVQGACVVTEESIFCQFQSTALVRKVQSPEEVKAEPLHQFRAKALRELAEEYGESPDANDNTSCEDLARWIDGWEGIIHPWVAITHQSHEGDVHYFYPCEDREEARERSEQAVMDPTFEEEPVALVNLDNKEREEASVSIAWPNPGRTTPIIVTGGDTGIGETLRGEILHIDYDEAKESLDYAREMLAAADLAQAPDVVIESLVDIITDGHGEPVESKFMAREARIAELEGYDELNTREGDELAWLRDDEARTPAAFEEHYF